MKHTSALQEADHTAAGTVATRIGHKVHVCHPQEVADAEDR